MIRAIALAPLLLPAMLLAGCGDKAPSPDDAPLVVSAVSPLPAGDADALPGERYAVTLRHDREARLAFRLPGTLAAISARPGDRLAKGAVVAALDPAPFAAAATRAAADLNRASRAADRYGQLASAGAVGEAQAKDASDQLAAARAADAAAHHDLADTTLRMPFTGVVIDRAVEVGEVVGPGVPVAVVADTGSPLIAVGQLPAALAARLKAGAVATLDLAGHAPIHARLRHTPGGADPLSGMARIELSIDQTPDLITGLGGSLRFAGQGNARAGGILTLPAEALLWVRGGQAAVFAIDPHGRAHRITLPYLGLEGGRARLAGLDPHARIITEGAGFASEGQKVEVAGP